MMQHLRDLGADYRRFREHGYSGWGSEGFWALAIHRAQKIANDCGRLALPVQVGLAVVKKGFALLTGIDIARQATIGAGTLIPHPGSIRIHPRAVIGKRCAIHHIVTIGAVDKNSAPWIGDNVMIGCHSCLLGSIVVGPGAKIGAGAVVTKNVPAGGTVTGANIVHGKASWTEADKLREQEWIRAVVERSNKIRKGKHDLS